MNVIRYLNYKNNVYIIMTDFEKYMLLYDTTEIYVHNLL